MAFPTTPVRDNFNRANNASLGAAWIPFVSGDGRWGIVSNQADCPATWAGDAYATPCATLNQEVHAKLTGQPASPGASEQTHLYLRVKEEGTSAPDAFGIVFLPGLSGGTLQIHRLTNNAGAPIASRGSYPVPNGDSLGLEVKDSLLTAYHKAAAGIWTPVTDLIDIPVTILQGGNTTDHQGFKLAIEANQTDFRWDDFGGGDIQAQVNETDNFFSFI